MDRALRFAALTADELPLAKKFYKAARYSSKVDRRDEVYVVRSAQEIIACCRLTPVSTYLLLRAMVVAPAHRGEGVGNFLLKNLASQISRTPCWCFPFSHLESFYQKAGFSNISPADTPHEIRNLFDRYRGHGRDILLMKYA